MKTDNNEMEGLLTACSRKMRTCKEGEVSEHSDSTARRAVFVKVSVRIPGQVFLTALLKGRLTLCKEQSLPPILFKAAPFVMEFKDGNTHNCGINYDAGNDSE